MRQRACIVLPREMNGKRIHVRLAPAASSRASGDEERAARAGRDEHAGNDEWADAEVHEHQHAQRLPHELPDAQR